jgi:BlaI family transcriptional regulator, penicillinase repressor
MDNYKLCDSDYRFMLVAWANAPVGSGRLVDLCREQLGWKKSTTYTAIKKMSEKGLIRNEDAVVTILVPKEDVQAVASDYFLDHTFAGSLPQFLAAFLGNRTISDSEADEIKRLIDAHQERPAGTR